MPDTDWNRVKEIFTQAMCLGPKDRDSFLNDVCGTNIVLRNEVESLLGHDRDAARDAFLEGELSSSESSLPYPTVQANIGVLFGLVAHVGGFISREDLVAASKLWLQDKSIPFDEVLLKHDFISTEEREQIQGLSLSPFANNEDEIGDLIDSSLEIELGALEDVDVDATLAQVNKPSQLTANRSEASPPNRYKVKGLHEKGGLGAVFVAQDEELDREVALKEIQSKYATDPFRRNRFLQEAEITGKLEHPGIVPVYGMGKHDDGRPYYAMRFIRGDSLNVAIRKFHTKEFTPWRSTEARLELRRLLSRFIDACNAIEYAHSRGVVHRDLKPSNIMLGEHGETLVVDWGLAKVVGRQASGQVENMSQSTLDVRPAGDSDQSAAGSVSGTLAYMSPEQADPGNHPIGSACDIYSLGATLYCLLTGSPSQEADPSAHVVLDRIARGEFLRPRQLEPKVPKPLQAITLKAMALRPSDRYESAKGIANDIERWLADEKVEAYRDSYVELLHRFVRRHSGWAAAIAVSLVVITAFSYVAARARGIAENRTVASVAYLTAAQDAIDTWLTEPAEELQDYPAVQQFRREILQKATDDYGRLAQTIHDDPRVQLEQARTLIRLGDAEWELGDVDKAEQSYEKVEQVLIGRSDRPSLLALSQCRTRLGNLLYLERGRPEEAETYFSSAADSLDVLRAKESNDQELLDAVGTCLLHEGSILVELHRFEEAVAMLTESLTTFSQAIKLVPNDDTRFLDGIAAARTELGRVFMLQGKQTEAGEVFRNVVDSGRILVEQNPAHPQLLESLTSAKRFLAQWLRHQGLIQEEMVIAREIVTSYADLFNRFPDVSRYKEGLALARMELGQTLQIIGNTRMARVELLQAHESFRLLVRDHPLNPRYQRERGVACDDLAQVLTDLGEYETANEFSQEAANYLQLLTTTVGREEHQYELAIIYGHSINIHHGLGDAVGAYQALVNASSILMHLADATSADNSHYLNALAICHQDFAEVANSDLTLARAIEHTNHARRYWQDAVSSSNAIPEILNNYARFSAICTDANHGAEDGISYAKAALELAPQSPDFAGTLGALLFRAGKLVEAERELRRAIELRKGGTAFDRFFLAMTLHGMDHDMAESEYQLGVEWLTQNRPGNFKLQRLCEEAAGKLGLTHK